MFVTEFQGTRPWHHKRQVSINMKLKQFVLPKEKNIANSLESLFLPYSSNFGALFSFLILIWMKRTRMDIIWVLSTPINSIRTSWMRRLRIFDFSTSENVVSGPLEDRRDNAMSLSFVLYIHADLSLLFLSLCSFCSFCVCIQKVMQGLLVLHITLCFLGLFLSGC